MYHIYKIKNKFNDKLYIGYTSDYKARWKTHKNKYKSENKVLYSAFIKYGIDNFEFSIIYSSNNKSYTKNVMEKYFIKKYNTKSPNGYNMTNGGDGGPGVTSEKATEYNNRRIENGSHIWLSEEIRNSNSVRMKENNPMYNKEIVSKSKEKYKETCRIKRENGIKGNPKSEEHKLKLSEARKLKSDRYILNEIKILYESLNEKPKRGYHLMTTDNLEKLKKELEQRISNN